MKPQLDEAKLADFLEESVRSTLENLLFMEAEPDETTAFPEGALWSRLQALSPVPCQLTLELPERLACRLSEELLLDLEEGRREQLTLDTVAELLNTIGGSFLGLVSDDDEVRMGLPECGRSPLQFEPPTLSRTLRVGAAFDDLMKLSIELR